jgi:hypothetical protein
VTAFSGSCASSRAKMLCSRRSSSDMDREDRRLRFAFLSFGDLGACGRGRAATATADYGGATGFATLAGVPATIDDGDIDERVGC